MGLFTLTVPAGGHDKLFKRYAIRLYSLPSSITLYDDCEIEPTTSIQAGIVPHSFIKVGAFCAIGNGRLGNVVVGRYCSLGPGFVTGVNEHPTEWLSTSRVLYQPELFGWLDHLNLPNRGEIIANKHDAGNTSKRIFIGNDVWVGQDVYIKGGVTIGDGAIVAARSVVTRDVEPYTVVGGVPAKFIKRRFPKEIADRLQASQWWKYSIFDMYDIDFTKIDTAIEEIERRISSGSIQAYEPGWLSLEDLQRAMS